MKIYFVYLLMREEELHEQNRFGQYHRLLHTRTIDGIHRILWAFSEKRSIIKEFKKSRRTKSRYEIVPVHMSECEYSEFMLENYNRELLPAALCVEETICRGAYLDYEAFKVYNGNLENMERYRRVIMTKDEYDFIVNNASEIIQEIKIEFFRRYQKILPVCLTMFLTKFTRLLFLVGYTADVLTYHPDAIYEMSDDKDLRELCKISIEHEDMERYSEFRLFLLTYQDIIY